jgi:hypothetical protein
MQQQPSTGVGIWAGRSPDSAQGRHCPIRRNTMSKLARAITIGAMLAAMNLAGMTAVAQAQSSDTNKQDTRRPPTEGQVGESWHQRATVPADPTGDASSPVARLGGLAALLALAGGLAVLAVRRAGRKLRADHAA